MGKPGTKSARFGDLLLAGAFDETVVSAALATFRKELPSTGSAEHAYGKAVDLTRRKHFGQFFTPEPIARLMGRWIRKAHPDLILDPAIGPGVFARVMRELCPTSRIVGIDVDEVAVRAAGLVLGGDHALSLIRQDFLTWSDERLFDAVIANPPYLRHHDLNYDFDIFQFVGTKNHIRVSKLSNIYVLFILEICRRLRVGGRAAVIVPGEWVNANFGDKLKLWLISRGLLHSLIYFSHASTQFEDALTTASILLLEQPPTNQGREIVRTVFVNNGALDVVEGALDGQGSGDGNVVVRDFSPDHLLREKKWNHVLAHGHTQSVPGFVKLAEIADTRRGIATGCNSYFHLSPSAAKSLRLRSENLTPCIGRATDVTGVVFGEQDFEHLVSLDARTLLFDMRDEPNDEERKYIESGKLQGVQDRYLCSARDTWYEMERRPPSPIWAAVFGRAGLRFIHNIAGIANLTTFHCVYPRSSDAQFASALTACLNSGVVQDRARRQHRVYGGGLLKFEPKDLLDIEVPDLRKVSQKTLADLAEMLVALDDQIRRGAKTAQLSAQLNDLVSAAACEAASSEQQIADCVPVNTQVTAYRHDISIMAP